MIDRFATGLMASGFLLNIVEFIHSGTFNLIITIIVGFLGVIAGTLKCYNEYQKSKQYRKNNSSILNRSDSFINRLFRK